ncbi:small G protein signaling modulator 1-like isoform X1 [Senna tora]|uniref:Small G protein signaling modulator 1-like isoform X1 n=1 Tax=Senna tora TaxID=362788 RepID=A0A834SL08_9FABA|nr:small G protein signaling modulator 1-like isoform X1 [Senna tora]
MRSAMHCGGQNKLWTCGKAGTVNLQKVTSIVRDIGDPCLSHSPGKVVLIVNRMLKPDKWQATFDSEGKVSGFHKTLKSIVLGGIDPSIRPEVWEFLLGCYALDSTSEYRRRLREARREHYRGLIKQCQTMHSSVGTGSLAYIVGSKVMDMRTSSKGDQKIEAEIELSTANDNNVEERKHCNRGDTCTASQQESSSDWVDLISLRSSIDNAEYDSYSPKNCSSVKLHKEAYESLYDTDSYFDFPALPVTNLFEQGEKDKISCMGQDVSYSAQRKLRFEDDRMHSFEISNNVDLVIESNVQQPLAAFHPIDSNFGIVSPVEDEPELLLNNPAMEAQGVNQLRVSDVPQPAIIRTSISQGKPGNGDRVSEWLWTLHRIVVDVVRTDIHLEFYEDRRNLARMSDILAVYAWVDPATGYCQGMSDLLSPFVVLFEDDADAFWCFEMLIRRMRDNFLMEGPTGVIKQLEALWHILELTDREMFAHLSKIGAESLHFAFPMLLVLFRRELSFNEALSMWEMMWAADFDEFLAYDLEEKCLEALVVQLPEDSGHETREEKADTNDKSVRGGSLSNYAENYRSTKAGLQPNHGNIDNPVFEVKLKSMSSHSFCGLTRNFWPRNDHIEMSTVSSLSRKENDELPIFCVAAILVINRQKIIRETHSFDDMIKAGVWCYNVVASLLEMGNSVAELLILLEVPAGGPP